VAGTTIARSGEFVALVSTPYEITDKDSGEIKRGHAHKLYLVEPDGSAVHIIKCPDRFASFFRDVPRGSLLDVTVSLFARSQGNGRAVIEESLADFPSSVGA
jgi:hypothetical protein